jgi:hypothetical protein
MKKSKPEPQFIPERTLALFFIGVGVFGFVGMLDTPFAMVVQGLVPLAILFAAAYDLRLDLIFKDYHTWRRHVNLPPLEEKVLLEYSEFDK